jgi:F0F1-type ATP synthase assembly protein I
MADRRTTTSRTGSTAVTPAKGAAPSAKAAKATRAAARQRRKDSTDPADMGRFRQIAQAYKVTHEFDPQLPFVLLAAFLLPVVVAVVVGLLWDHLVYLLIMGLLVGLLLAMALLVRRAKRATFKRYEGQTGSAEVALSMLPKQWISSPVIAATRQRDVVHRTLGPGGVVLIGEGEAGRVRQLLTSEARKHERVAYGVTVTTLVMGDASNQVPLNKLTDRIRKLPKVLEPNQVTDLKARLRALDAVRPVVAMPKGPMPTRGARQATRGR